MKKLLCSLFLPAMVWAQQDFGRDATWYYSFGEFGYSGYKKIQHVSDSIVDGISWLRFEVSGKRQIRTGPNPNDLVQDTAAQWPDLFLGTRNDSVFRWIDGGPYLLYDFNADVGDSWQFAPYDSAGACPALPLATVIAKGVDTLNGVALDYMDLAMPKDTLMIAGQPVFQISSSSYLHQRVYRDLGSRRYSTLFEATPNLCNGASFKTAQLASHSLRCFSSPQLSVNVGSNPCDQWSNIGLEEQTVKQFRVYPNPSNDFINVEADFELSALELRSLDGRLIARHVTDFNEIPLPQAEGLYILVLITPSGERLVEKLLRN